MIKERGITVYYADAPTSSVQVNIAMFHEQGAVKGLLSILIGGVSCITKCIFRNYYGKN